MFQVLCKHHLRKRFLSIRKDPPKQRSSDAELTTKLLASDQLIHPRRSEKFSVPAWLERRNSSSPAFPVKHQLIYLTWPVCQHSQRQGKINMFTSFTEDSILRQTRGQVWINTHTLVCPLGLASEAHPKLSHHCQAEVLLRQPLNGTPGCTQAQRHLEARITSHMQACCTNTHFGSLSNKPLGQWNKLRTLVCTYKHPWETQIEAF